MGFTVYQMDVKSAFIYDTIEEDVYVYQPLSFVNPSHPNKVYKVIKALYGLYPAPRAWYETLSSFLMENGFRRDTIDKTLKANTPIESNKPLVKDEAGEGVDVHVYRSMIGSLVYLTALRPDIMFVVCVYARFQVTPKASHLNAVKRIFRYLKHQPKLGLWYPRDSPFELEAISDSDYGGASLDRKSTIAVDACTREKLDSDQEDKKQDIDVLILRAENHSSQGSCRTYSTKEEDLLMNYERLSFPPSQQPSSDFLPTQGLHATLHRCQFVTDTSINKAPGNQWLNTRKVDVLDAKAEHSLLIWNAPHLMINRRHRLQQTDQANMRMRYDSDVELRPPMLLRRLHWPTLSIH
ncbi:putative ribonuclease H-like domain-containing protein [Tanacetum coccineum]|uniref:Ribonuclease H-like domain-containing protein n=1 Tax=Tanacetum coccineum TaxID=301880 RepID=A0ABQ4XAX7_9ASTR